MLEQAVSLSRRFNSRIQTTEGVWVYWYCNGHGGASRVRDVSLGGVFVETTKAHPVRSTAEVDFLAQEGQIRTEAIARHLEPGRGLGLKFTAVKDGDRPRLTRLMNRVRSLPR